MFQIRNTPFLNRDHTAGPQLFIIPLLTAKLGRANGDDYFENWGVQMTSFANPKLQNGEVVGRVKWFDQVKGYGFIVTGDGSADILVHQTALRRAGIKIAPEGATITCSTVNGSRGLQVDRVIAIDNSTARLMSHSFERDDQTAGFEKPLIDGVVKWFDRLKGYGFVSRGTGTLDVFVHNEILRQCGIAELNQGDKVRISVESSPRGELVTFIEFG